MQIPSKLRDPKPWIATFSLTLFILRTYFKVEIIDSDILINLFLGFMGAWGIWITPGLKDGDK